ncbi:ABC transporter ATP-binding protein [Rossellomorea marisflavi]|uniref:ABC transporter ATP-binding protein n=1 Tax=Rossellomorea marisflavi TaxID=189381 RepID=UPI003457514A
MIVQIDNLTKRYKDKKAIDDVSLQIREGETVGIIGPNGAGKTSTIKSICGIMNFDSGQIRIFDKDIMKHGIEIKKQIGVVPQEIAIFEDLSAYDNVIFFGKLYGLTGGDLKSKVRQALEFTGLWEKKKASPKTFSGGMKRRLNIACSIVHEPRLLIMDEPTVGIDAQSRNHILKSIKKLNEKGTTIIYTSHYMKEVEEICSRICILDNGKVELEGTYDEIKNEVFLGQKLILALDDFKSEVVTEIEGLPHVESCTYSEKKIMVNCNDTGGETMKNIMEIIERHELRIMNVSMEEVSLEGVYLKITGENIRD